MSTKGRDEKEFIVFLTGDRIKYLSSVGLEHRIKGKVVGNWGLALGFQVIVLIFLRWIKTRMVVDPKSSFFGYLNTQGWQVKCN